VRLGLGSAGRASVRVRGSCRRGGAPASFLGACAGFGGCWACAGLGRGWACGSLREDAIVRWGRVR